MAPDSDPVLGPEFDHLETDPGTVLDPDEFGGAAWADALEDGDADAARAAFVEDLRRGDERTAPETDLAALRRRWHDAEIGHERGFDLDPDLVVENRYVGVYGVEHVFEDGVDWYHDPTAESAAHDATGEWQWQLNRHYQWITLADAYAATDDARYAAAFEDELRSWVAACPRPEDSGNYHPSAWRTIEAGIRAGWVWPYAFETFRRSADVSDGALWLLVCALREHGVHLLRHPTGRNWKAMETNGLAHVGGMFPELDGARAFLSTAVDRAVGELERQFYPDGLQTELAPSYAGVAIANTYSALALAEARGPAHSRASDLSVPRRSFERLETIADAYARLAAPDGYCPPIHDSGRFDATPYFEAFGDGHGDPPWASGRPDHLEWGGFGVLRRGDRYGLLDAGPYGTAHQHQDALQVLGYAGGAWVLADPGSPQYTDAPETEHVRSAAGHNVALLDGERHAAVPEVPKAEDPLPMAFARGDRLHATAATRSFETESGARFDHERVLADADGVGWVVFDAVRPRDETAHAVEWLWHAPGDDLAAEGTTGVADFAGGARLRVAPVATRALAVDAVAAERDPLRGWGPRGETSDPGPFPAFRVASAVAAGAVEAATLLAPATDGPPPTVADADLAGAERTLTVAAGGDRATLTFGDADADADAIRRVTYEPLDGGAPVALDLDGHAFLAD